MPNEMRRPCTLWGETFDACYVLKLSTSYVKANRHHVYINGEWVSSPAETGRYVVVSTTRHRYFSPLVKTGAERQALLLEAITTIAEALNAPVLATEVLAGLPQGSNFIAHKVGYSPIWQSAYYCAESKKWWSQDEPLDESYIIKSDGCSETLARLLQFTLQGVRIKEGG